ncbi:class D sortase [Paenibacillus thailandensis]|uniref:Class D sortase n=1 Tax=Paenibacillus thailandensis TaxID=393250 RepID=A0ABW5QYC0_9BACL
MKIKGLALLLIVAGLLLIAMPKLTELYYDAQQEKLIRSWENAMLTVDNGEDGETDAASPVEPVMAAAPQDGEADNEAEGMEGLLVIDKIDLKLPILYGATKENMKKSAASIEGTGKAGEIGNFAVAGHRNRTFGRNFNRLDELEEGDTIEVEVAGNRYAYTVTEKPIVKPEDVWVLEGNGKDREITLVTCHPMVNPTERLIIKGKIV